MTGRPCDVCGQPLDDDEDVHQAHERSCDRRGAGHIVEAAGYCWCDLLVHPWCCPDCHPTQVPGQLALDLDEVAP